MKKSLIRTIAVSLIAASFFSVTTSKSTTADTAIGKCGQRLEFYKGAAVARYAKSLVGKTYYQMPDPIQMDGHWCAAFTKYVYFNIGETVHEYNRVTKIVEYNKGRFETSKNYKPGPGDLIVYEENGNTGNGYEHIGVVVNTVAVNGEYCPETVEGNYFDIDCSDEDILKVSYDDYWELSKNNNCKDRKVGFVPYNRVRRHMIAGYIKSELKTIRTVYGDVNADGKVNAADATLILRALLEMDFNDGVLKKSIVDNMSVAEFYYRMDANGDGKVTQSDATAILRWSKNR